MKNERKVRRVADNDDDKELYKASKTDEEETEGAGEGT